MVSFRDISSFKEITKFLENHSHFYGIVGKSRQMQEIFKLIEEISETDATVFIHGETGSGKELIADAIFETSRRKQKKFVKVNCSVLPGQLLASELFGHAKGAFTDAVKDRIGRFEFADEGTILLDEVAEMPLQMQSQLLRVIQEGTFERLGESVTRKVNVRILAATNMNIELALESGKFREDLFYRLNVIPIHLPPLRNRKEDIPFLLDHFLKKYSLLYKKNSFEFDDSVMDVFNSYDWPGNVRELENVVEYTVIRSKEGMRISVCSLPLHLRKLTDCKKKIDPDLKNSIEYSQLLKLLEQYRWNKTKVAEVLGVNRTTIWRKLKSIGIE